MSKKQHTKFEPFQFEPFMFLEGGKGLHETEEAFSRKLFSLHEDFWILDDLYAKPERLASIKFLKPKTLILGTTGVMKEELQHLSDIFLAMEFYPDNIIFSLIDTERKFYSAIEILNKMNPNVRYFQLEHMVYEDDEIELTELKHLKD